MERLYKKINAESELIETDFGRVARGTGKAPKSAVAENRKIWREMIALSRNQFEKIYARLGVKFDYSLGESFYNDASNRSWTNCLPTASPAKAKAPLPFSSTTIRN